MDTKNNGLWGRLTEPSLAISETEKRRQARLLASMMLILIPLGFLATIMQAIADEDAPFWPDAEFRQMFWIMLFTISMYILSRTRFYGLLTWLVVISISFIIFIMAFPEHGDDDFDIALFYLVIPVLLAALFISIRAAVVFAATNTLNILLFAHLIPGVELSRFVIGPFTFMIVMSAFILLAIHYRNQINIYQQEEIAENNARLQAIFDNVSVGIAVINVHGRFLQTNGYWQKLIGYNQEELQTLTFLDVTHPDDTTRNQADFMTIIRGEQPALRLEKRYISKNNCVFWVNLSATPIYKQNNQIDAIVMLIIDITERKQAELEREQLFYEFETLIQLTTTLRQVDTPTAIAKLFLQLAVTTTEATYASFFSDERVPESVRLCLHFPPTSSTPPQPTNVPLDKVSAHYGEVAIVTEPANDAGLSSIYQKIPWAKEAAAILFVILQTRSTIIGILCLGTAKVEQFGEREVRLLKAMADVAANALHRTSVLETLEQQVAHRTYELAAANAQLTSLDRLKSQFINDISHELRTPLTNLKLYVKLLENGPPEKHAHYLKIIQDKVNQLVQLSEGILLTSQLDLGHGRETVTAVNLNQIVHLATENLEAQIQKAGLHINLIIDDQLPKIEADEKQLMVLMTNMLKNSLNYTRKGSMTVSTQAQNGAACLTIEDTGIGIAAEDLPYIFDRFYRGHNVGQLNMPGSGLGLAIVKRIVELHNGSIKVESVTDQFTRFFIYFPVYHKVS